MTPVDVFWVKQSNNLRSLPRVWVLFVVYHILLWLTGKSCCVHVCKDKRQDLLTSQVSRYCLVASQSRLSPVSTKHFVYNLYNVGPTFSTLDQLCINVIQMFCVYWDVHVCRHISSAPQANYTKTLRHRRVFLHVHSVGGASDIGGGHIPLHVRRPLPLF